MARVDDFLQSLELTAESLRTKSLSDVAEASGAELIEDRLQLIYYGRPLAVELDPAKVMALDDGPELPPAEQALVMHYLDRATGREPTDSWITYRETKEGAFYWAAFFKRAIRPLTDFFGHQPGMLLQLSPMVGGEKSGGVADAQVIITAFPRVRLLYQIWEGDDEFEAKGNVLMDEHIEDYLSAEDIALACGLPIYKMMAMSRG